MSNEEVEAGVASVMEQQTRLTADVAKLQEGMCKITETVGELASNLGALLEGLVDMKNVMLSLTHIAKEHQEQIGEMINYGNQVNDLLKETDSRLSVLLRALEPWVDGSKPN